MFCALPPESRTFVNLALASSPPSRFLVLGRLGAPAIKNQGADKASSMQTKANGYQESAAELQRAVAARGKKAKRRARKGARFRALSGPQQARHIPVDANRLRG